jgi:hypothetical protein
MHARRVSHKMRRWPKKFKVKVTCSSPFCCEHFWSWPELCKCVFVCSEKGHRVAPFALWTVVFFVNFYFDNPNNGWALLGVISWLCACVNFEVRLICNHLSLEINSREYNRGVEVSLFDCGFCSARAAAAIWNCLIISFYSEHLIGDRVAQSRWKCSCAWDKNVKRAHGENSPVASGIYYYLYGRCSIFSWLWRPKWENHRLRKCEVAELTTREMGTKVKTSKKCMGLIIWWC